MIELDPATLRELARELSDVADEAGAAVDNDREQYLAGFCATLAATYRTRALRVEINWNAPTRELPIVTPRGRGNTDMSAAWRDD